MEPVRSSANRLGESERQRGSDQARPAWGGKREAEVTETEEAKQYRNRKGGQWWWKRTLVRCEEKQKKKDRKNTVNEGRAKKVERRVSKAHLNPRNRGWCPGQTTLYILTTLLQRQHETVLPIMLFLHSLLCTPVVLLQYPVQNTTYD